MTPFFRGWTAVVVALVSALSACGGATGSRSAAAPEPSRPSPPDSATIARVRADSARYPYTEADVRFMSGMIGHHSQAILIAGWAATHGANRSVLTLAERIVNGQQDEIRTMQQWLADRGKPVPDGSRTGMTMHHGTHHDRPMPGMLTEAQLRQLDQARGADFDRLFLANMIQHHNGAVSMVQELFGTPGAARDETVFKFANDVSVDQSTEVARMEKMLAALPPE